MSCQPIQYAYASHLALNPHQHVLYVWHFLQLPPSEGGGCHGANNNPCLLRTAIRDPLKRNSKCCATSPTLDNRYLNYRKMVVVDEIHHHHRGWAERVSKLIL